jgi:hypothetical protein
MRRTIVARALVAALLILSACDDAPDRGGDDHVVSGGAADDRTDATFIMAGGADVVQVRARDLDGDLYRVSKPDDAKVVPVVSLDGDVLTATLRDASGTGPAVVTAELSAAVRWQIRLDGGAKEEIVDLTAGRVAGVDFVAGTSRAEVSLPRPNGAVEVVLAGGASQFLVHLTGQVPARVRIGGGAGTVDVEGERRTGVAAGTVLTTSGWTGTGDRYDIDVTAGVSSLVVNRLRPTGEP